MSGALPFANQGNVKEKRDKFKKLAAAETSRQASKKHVLRVDKICEVVCGEGLEKFQNLQQLAELGLLEGARTGKFADPLPRLPEGLVVKSLSICTDQEQTQITGGEFIFAAAPKGLGCTGVRFHDEFHRWHNDLKLATSLAGLEPAVQAGTLIFNLGYGPWQSHAFFHQICATRPREQPLR